tara:strand:+ start:701 stop:1210 length:510 start_codon:yes stop_codon:yes gene_type:complete
MDIKDIINILIQQNNYQSMVQIKGKDLISQITLDTSCYKTQVPEGAFDLIYLGELEGNLLYKDIVSSLKILSPNGTIVISNLNPMTSDAQLDNKDGWRAWVTKRNYDFEITQRVIDTSDGIGLITKGNQEPWDKPGPRCYNYYYLDFYRKDLLNLITLDEFINTAIVEK